MSLKWRTHNESRQEANLCLLLDVGLLEANKLVQSEDFLARKIHEHQVPHHAQISVHPIVHNVVDLDEQLFQLTEVCISNEYIHTPTCGCHGKGSVM